jgi:hypothetical protein
MKHSTFRPQLQELEPLVLPATATSPIAQVPLGIADPVLASAAVEPSAPVTRADGNAIAIDWGNFGNTDPGNLGNDDVAALTAAEQRTTDRIARTDQRAGQIGLMPGSEYVPPPEQLAPMLAQGQLIPGDLRQALDGLVAPLTEQKARLYRRTAAAAAAERQVLADPYATFADELAARIKVRGLQQAWRQASADLLDVQRTLQAPDDQLVQKTLDLIAAWSNRLEKAAKATEAQADQLRQQGAQRTAQADAAITARGWCSLYDQQQRDLQALLRALPNP